MQAGRLSLALRLASNNLQSQAASAGRNYRRGFGAAVRMAQVHGASVGASRDQAELGTSGAPPPVFRVENSSTADAASTATSAQASAELRDNVFAFDLNGFVVVRGALSAAEVGAGGRWPTHPAAHCAGHPASFTAGPE